MRNSNDKSGVSVSHIDEWGKLSSSSSSSTTTNKSNIDSSPVTIFAQAATAELERHAGAGAGTGAGAGAGAAGAAGAGAGAGAGVDYVDSRRPAVRPSPQRTFAPPAAPNPAPPAAPNPAKRDVPYACDENSFSLQVRVLLSPELEAPLQYYTPSFDVHSDLRADVRTGRYLLALLGPPPCTTGRAGSYVLGPMVVLTGVDVLVLPRVRFHHCNVPKHTRTRSAPQQPHAREIVLSENFTREQLEAAEAARRAVLERWACASGTLVGLNSPPLGAVSLSSPLSHPLPPALVNMEAYEVD